MGIDRKHTHRRGGDFHLHIGFRQYRNDTEQGTDAAGDGTVLGVGLGLENIAVTSTARFFLGDELIHRFDRFEGVRGGLQQTEREAPTKR